MEQRRLTVVWLLFCAALAQADEVPRANPAREPALRLELLRRVKADQEACAACVEWEKANGQGVRSTPRLSSAGRKAESRSFSAPFKGPIERTRSAWERSSRSTAGRPSRSSARDGSNAAWLLVQHADAEPKFQRKCLDLMTKLPQDEVSQTDLAYLTDRVLLAEGKKQIYGTQFTSSGGKWEPRPTRGPRQCRQAAGRSRPGPARRVR